jgi:hypothetical protein
MGARGVLSKIYLKSKEKFAQNKKLPYLCTSNLND